MLVTVPQFLSCLKFQQNLARGGARESERWGGVEWGVRNLAFS